MNSILFSLLIVPLSAKTTEVYKGKTPQGDDCTVLVEVVDPLVHRDFTRRISVKNDTKNLLISPVVVKQIEAPTYINSEGHPSRTDLFKFTGYRYFEPPTDDFQGVVLLEASGSGALLTTATVQFVFRNLPKNRDGSREVICKNLVLSN